MSGFVAIVNMDGAPVDRVRLDRMTAAMTFRGPDGESAKICGAVGMGVAALSTNGGMSSAPIAALEPGLLGAGDVRIDDRDRLLDELGERAAAPPTDISLVLRAYRKWGDAFVDHLLGDFAFAIWDAARHSLLAVRDQFGVRPLFYAHSNTSLVVSNTMDAIRHHPGVSNRLDDVAIADFLATNYQREAHTTSFADIRRVPAAHVLVATGSDLRTRKYWTFPLEGRLRFPRPEDYVEGFKEVFGRAVGDRTASTTGIFLSGGLDSSSVAAAVKRHPNRAVRDRDLRACTVIYDRLIPDEERHFAGIVARTLDIPTHFIAADDYPLYGHWDDPACCGPEPAQAPLAALLRDEYRVFPPACRVTLTGFGGDPLFRYYTDVVGLMKSGRPWQIGRDIVESLFMHHRLPPVGIRTTLRKLRHTKPTAVTLPPWLDESLARELRLVERYADLLARRVEPRHPVRGATHDELMTVRLAQTFEIQDAGVIRAPIESRHPFFDLRVVNYLLAIPPLPWAPNKELLRVALAGVLPDEVRLRPKTLAAVDPVVALCRDAATRQRLRSLVTAPTFAKYLSAKAFPPELVNYSAAISPELWTNLRPLSFEYWLRWSNVSVG